MSRAFRWAIVLGALISFALVLISIIVIRSTWHDEDRRESGIIWLYASAIAIFLTGVGSALSAEVTPDICRMPYSGRFAAYS